MQISFGGKLNGFDQMKSQKAWRFFFVKKIENEKQSELISRFKINSILITLELLLKQCSAKFLFSANFLLANLVFS